MLDLWLGVIDLNNLNNAKKISEQLMPIYSVVSNKRVGLPIDKR